MRVKNTSTHALTSQLLSALDDFVCKILLLNSHQLLIISFDRDFALSETYLHDKNRIRQYVSCGPMFGRCIRSSYCDV